LCFPKLKRSDEKTNSGSIFIASSTCDGFSDAELHAEPFEIAMSLLKARNRPAPFTKEKEIFEEAVGLLPDEEIQITHWQAICPLSQGDTTEANKYLNKGIGIGKQNGWPESEILSWLVNIHDQANNLIKAEELYRSAFIMNPHDKNLKNDFAYFLISNDINIEEGIELISRVLESKPNNGNYLHTYGLGLYKQGKLDEAHEALKKAWDLISFYDHDHFTHIQEVEYALASQNH
jgi:tetratricopeptide (TPR) repeat protein